MWSVTNLHTHNYYYPRLRSYVKAEADKQVIFLEYNLFMVIIKQIQKM